MMFNTDSVGLMEYIESGYMTYDPLVGYREINGVAQFRDEKQVFIPRKGMFGECKESFDL